MATPQPALDPSGTRSGLTLIQQEALKAIEILFANATRSGMDDPNIEDEKPDFPPQGPLQNAEFGMVLLLTRDWLKDRMYQSIKQADLEEVIIALLESTVNRVSVRRQTDSGGASGSIFFTGEPYTPVDLRMRRFSANLDSAMIIASFLA